VECGRTFPPAIAGIPAGEAHEAVVHVRGDRRHAQRRHGNRRAAPGARVGHSRLRRPRSAGRLRQPLPPPGARQTATANHTHDESGRVIDHITITCGEQVARIEDADLTLNGVPHGKVQRGDTIKLSASGKVFVNGELRSKQDERRP
jgi:hypothetical protein